MAWTSPRTWTTSELVSASIMNTHVRDNLSVTAAGVAASGDAYVNACFATAANTVDFLPAPLYVLKKATYTTVTNTASETTLCSDSVTGGRMGANGSLFLKIYTTSTNPSSDRTCTLRVKFDSTTILSDAFTVSAGANRDHVWIGYICNTNSESAQRTSIREDSIGAATGGYGTSSFDTSSTFTLAVTVQYAGAYSDTTMTHHFTTAELIK